MSCFTTQKGWIVKDDEYSQWCIGSDFPFSENFGVNYTSEKNHFDKWTLNIPDNNAVRFFESNIEELIEWCHERSLDYNEKGKLHRLKIKQLRKEKEQENLTDTEDRLLIGRVDHIVDEIIVDYFQEYTKSKYQNRFKELLSQTILDL
jgi:hypothetical protein